LCLACERHGDEANRRDGRCGGIPRRVGRGRIASETGLPVYVSEFDLPIADDNRQRQVMEGMVTMFWENPNVKGITLWGYIEGATWIGNSGLMSSGGDMRPAMIWLMDFLGR
jgi:endo-1,4-beta-xylanase